MKKLLVLLFLSIGIVGYSQTDYLIFKVRAGAFDGNTRKFDLKNSHPIILTIRISNDTLSVSDELSSYYLLGEAELEQNTDTLTVTSYKATDEKGRKCTIFKRMSRTIEHSSIVIVYSNYIIQYFIAHNQK